MFAIESLTLLIRGTVSDMDVIAMPIFETVANSSTSPSPFSSTSIAAYLVFFCLFFSVLFCFLFFAFCFCLYGPFQGWVLLLVRALRDKK